MNTIDHPVFLPRYLGFAVAGEAAVEFDEAHPVTGNVVSRMWEGIGDKEPHLLVEGEDVPRRWVPLTDLYTETGAGFKKLVPGS